MSGLKTLVHSCCVNYYLGIVMFSFLEVTREFVVSENTVLLLYGCIGRYYCMRGLVCPTQQ